MADARRKEAFRHLAAFRPTADEAADAPPVDAAAAVATWEAGLPSNSCYSTMGGFDSERPSNC